MMLQLFMQVKPKNICFPAELEQFIIYFSETFP